MGRVVEKSILIDVVIKIYSNIIHFLITTLFSSFAAAGGEEDAGAAAVAVEAREPTGGQQLARAPVRGMSGADELERGVADWRSASGQARVRVRAG